ncbi:hypothetical protein N7478_000748 [Penicillium angulare]|uniref:uncharacterized protein n=1 Tax=Penicillium angulare TaxID=116970 RepID=UPI00253FEAE6|nr:uncharacterized protein N7478_000748 [Penicillium angulare]KAJ5291497.1 hypothetical protein N7478_000748 [Penicillium angulare]
MRRKLLKVRYKAHEWCVSSGSELQTKICIVLWSVWCVECHFGSGMLPLLLTPQKYREDNENDEDERSI